MGTKTEPRVTLHGDRSKADVFDRQKRISGWAQDSIQNSRIIVVGAGAIGNELIKNLMLIGARRLLICDFDTIEPANLSRTVLFRTEDVGLSKASIAAERALNMALAEGPEIEAFHGDVVWDLGIGEALASDLLIGCLDNVEARRAINRLSRLAGVPYIDAGIRELSASVSIFGGRIGDVCYDCGLSEQQHDAARRRYSCDNTRREFIASERVPTVQITAALAAALQAQEAVRLLSGDRSMVGRRIIWHGKTNVFRNVELTEDPDCQAHVLLPEVEHLPVDAMTRLADFLDSAEAALGYGPVELDLSNDRSYVMSARCRSCGHEGPVMAPLHRVTDQDLRCLNPPLGACVHRLRPDQSLPESIPTAIEQVCHLSRDRTPQLLDRTLGELGIPSGHVVPVRGPTGTETYFSLATGGKLGRKAG